MGRPLRHSLRVRYAECDIQGQVFNAHYLTYFDQSMTELWRAAVGGYSQMLERGVDLVVVHAEVDFHSGARFDRELTLEVEVAHLGRTSVVTRHQIADGATPVATGELCHVFVDSRTLAKIPIPAWARAGLEPWLAGGADRSSES
jgi:acyl-CoA thioester hydrolase